MKVNDSFGSPRNATIFVENWKETEPKGVTKPLSFSEEPFEDLMDRQLFGDNLLREQTFLWKHFRMDATDS